MDQTACAVGKVITIDFKEVGHPVVRKFRLIWHTGLCTLHQRYQGQPR